MATLFLFILYLSGSYALTLPTQRQHHTVLLSSLLPTSACISSTQGTKNSKGSLEVVHRHGPCSQLTLDKTKFPTAADFLEQDQSRVDSIQSRFTSSSGKRPFTTSKATLPAKSGDSLGTGNYYVMVGLGTPKQQFALIFDTGSDLTWTQCQPCVQSCYKQQDPIYNPTSSITYQNISCTSTICSQLISATGNPPKCSSTTCVYDITYGDGSFSEGFLGTETLTFSATDSFPNFYFGCGQNNDGSFSFGGTAGLLGLGSDNLLVVSQTASKYGKYFSYCLPTPSSTGYLTFGRGGSSKPLKFTPMIIKSNQTSFYSIEIVAIKCGATILSIPQSIFKTAGAIIDSGTVITRLPPTAYSALRTEFRKQMAQYPSAPAVSILDTCYDLRNYTKVSIPVVSFYFGGNIEVPIASQGILYSVPGFPQTCLAFFRNLDDTDLVIFGNVQQQTMEVVYDVAGGKLGFGQNGCS